MMYMFLYILVFFNIQKHVSNKDLPTKNQGNDDNLPMISWGGAGGS